MTRVAGRDQVGSVGRNVPELGRTMLRG